MQPTQDVDRPPSLAIRGYLMRLGTVTASRAIAWTAIVMLGPSLATAGAAADDRRSDTSVRLRETLAARYPQVRIVDIAPSAIPGLWEVFTGDSIAYVDTSGEYLLLGPMMATASKQNLTATRVDELNRVDISRLPVDSTIQYGRGNGSRLLYIFSDPDCPYCQQLEQDLATIDDITVRIILYPLASIHPDAPAKARAIWCSADRVETWRAWMLEKRSPEPAQCEDTPIEALLALGRELRVISTPTIVLADGRRVSGAPSKEQLIALLDTHASAKP